MTKPPTTRHPQATRHSQPRTAPQRTPLWTLLTTSSVLVVVVQAARPLDDPDVWWHVRAGDTVLDSGRLPSRESWVWTAEGRRWVPTSWLSDVALALAHRADGWQGVRLLSVAVAAVFAIALTRLLRRTTSAVGAATACAVVVVACAGYLRERPQAASLCLAVVLAAWCEQTRRGSPPAWWRVGLVGWLWACVHGMWVLAPFALLLAGASGGRSTAKRAVPAVLAAVVAAAVTPVGPRLLVQPIVVAWRAREIAEWAPVQVLSWQAAVLAVLAALLLAVPRDERLLAGGLLVFGAVAARDVAPAAVLLSPLLARRLAVLLPASSSAVRRRAVGGLIGLGALATAALLIASPPVARSVPRHLVAALDRDVGAHVLVDYDIGGLVTGQARHVSAAVDGRTDVYDPGWLHAYLELTELRGSWRDTLRAVDPDRALLRHDGRLAQQLRQEGWGVVQTEGSWVLLAGPWDRLTADQDRVLPRL